MPEAKKFPVFVKLSKLQPPGTPSKIFSPELAPEDVLYQLVVSASPDQTVQSVIDQAKETLDKGFKYRFEFAYIAAITIRGFVFAPQQKVADFFAPDGELADRTITIYQNRLDRQATIPAGSCLRPPKRELQELSEDEQQHFKRFKIAHDADRGVNGGEDLGVDTPLRASAAVKDAPQAELDNRRDADGFVVPPRPVRNGRRAPSEVDPDAIPITNEPAERRQTTIPTPESPQDTAGGAAHTGYGRRAARDTPPSAQRPRDHPTTQKISSSALRARPPPSTRYEDHALPSFPDCLTQAGYTEAAEDDFEENLHINVDDAQASTLSNINEAERSDIAKVYAPARNHAHPTPSQSDRRPSSRRNKPVHSAFALLRSSQSERAFQSSPVDRARARLVGAASGPSSVRNPSTQTPSSSKGTSTPGSRVDNFLSGPWTMDETKKLAKGLREGLTCNQTLKVYNIQRNPSGARNRKQWIQKHRPEMLSAGYADEEQSPQLSQSTLQLVTRSQVDKAQTTRRSSIGGRIADSPAMIVSRMQRQISVEVHSQRNGNDTGAAPVPQSEQHLSESERRHARSNGATRPLRPFRRSPHALRSRRLTIEDSQDDPGLNSTDVGAPEDATETRSDGALRDAEQQAANEQLIRETQESQTVPNSSAHMRHIDDATNSDQISYERCSSELGRADGEIDDETLARYQRLANSQLRRMNDEESEDFYEDMQELARQTSIDLHDRTDAPSPLSRIPDVDEWRPDWIHAKTTDDEIRKWVDADIPNREVREIHYNINRYHRDLLRLECDGGHQSTAEQIKTKIYRHKLQLLGIDEGLPIEAHLVKASGESVETRRPTSRHLQAVILPSSPADYETAVDKFSDDSVTEQRIPGSSTIDAKSGGTERLAANYRQGRKPSVLLDDSTSTQSTKIDTADADVSDDDVSAAIIPGWKLEDDLPDAPTQIPIRKDMVGPVVAEVDDDGNCLPPEPRDEGGRNVVMDSFRAAFPVPKLVPCEAELQKQREELIAKGFSQSLLHEQYTLRGYGPEGESIPAEIPARRERREKDETTMRAQRADAARRRSKVKHEGLLQHSVIGTSAQQAQADQQTRTLTMNGSPVHRRSAASRPQAGRSEGEAVDDDLRILEVRPLGSNKTSLNRSVVGHDSPTVVGTYNQRIRATQLPLPQAVPKDTDKNAPREVRELAFAPTRGVRVRRSSVISNTRRAQQAARSASRSVEPSVVAADHFETRQESPTGPEIDRQREIARLMMSTGGFKAEIDRMNRDRAQAAAERRRKRGEPPMPAQTAVNGEPGVAAPSPQTPASALQALRSKREARHAAQAQPANAGSVKGDTPKVMSHIVDTVSAREFNGIADDSIVAMRSSDNLDGERDNDGTPKAKQVETSESPAKTKTPDNAVGVAEVSMSTANQASATAGDGNERPTGHESDAVEKLTAPSARRLLSDSGSNAPDREDDGDAHINEFNAEGPEKARHSIEAVSSESTATPDIAESQSPQTGEHRNREAKPRFSSIALSGAATTPSKFLRDQIRYGPEVAASKWRRRRANLASRRHSVSDHGASA